MSKVIKKAIADLLSKGYFYCDMSLSDIDVETIYLAWNKEQRE